MALFGLVVMSDVYSVHTWVERGESVKIVANSHDDAKRKGVESVKNNLEKVGIDPESVRVVVDETVKEP